MANNIKNDETSTSIIIPSDNIQKKVVTVTVIRELVKAIKEQLKELDKMEHSTIDSTNCGQIEGILIATDSLINDCYSSKEFTCNRNDNFIKLIYLYQRTSIKLETYRLQEVIKEVEHKNEELKERQIELENSYNKSKEDSNNLVYNLLGFLTSFSIVSASVEAISEIDGIINIMIFISFTILILLTTLIALHNFYKNDNRRETKLQNNYFLWKIVAIIVVILFIVSGIKSLKDNKENILNYLDNKIEKVIENIVEKKVEEN